MLTLLFAAPSSILNLANGELLCVEFWIAEATIAAERGTFWQEIRNCSFRTVEIQAKVFNRV